MAKLALVVDDDADVVELLRHVLGYGGFEMRVAPNGREALRLAALHPPGVILLDIMMPGMDGATVLAEFRRQHALDQTRIIMLTAKDDRAAREEAYRLGADDYVTKPFHPRDLLEKIGAKPQSGARPRIDQ